MTTTELARAAGVHPLAMSEEYISGLERLVAAAVAAAVAAEREACAKAAETAPDLLQNSTFDGVAAAIRARGQA